VIKNIIYSLKVWIQLGKDGRMIGFKYALPYIFPQSPPLVFLDEPINKQVIEFVDYVEDNNRLSFLYLDKWTQSQGANSQ